MDPCHLIARETQAPSGCGIGAVGRTGKAHLATVDHPASDLAVALDPTTRAVDLGAGPGSCPAAL